MLEFLKNILAIDSTSGKENEVVDFIKKNLRYKNATTEVQNTPNGFKNLFFKWGKPKIVFCTHLDTVPPYFPPKQNKQIISGRGSVDAKGQIAVMAEVCHELEQENQTDFGLLLVAGEEAGSYGAKAANKLIKGVKYTIIGEPTENKLIKASKGTMHFKITMKGKAAHSGYPKHGDSAIMRFHGFVKQLEKIKFPKDKILGDTNYNLAALHAHNAHNVIPDEVTFRLFFRTTFKSHPVIFEKLKKLCDAKTNIEFIDENVPIEFHTISGFKTDVVAFCSDAQSLTNLGNPLLYGPGSILVAHTKDEKIKISELKIAVQNLKKIYYKLKKL
jgi:acetylornithine deacetylase